MKRDIWFYNVLGWYYPCHWKGFAIGIGFVALILLGAFGGQVLLDAQGYDDADWLPFPLFFVAGFVPLMVIARRHS